jgi:hypothetical protein
VFSTAVAITSLFYATTHATFNPTVAFASPPNCTGEGSPHHFQGAKADYSYGSFANLVVGAADLCSNPLTGETNHISAWALMYSTSNPCYLAQSGYRQTVDYNYWLEFEEYETDGCASYFETSFGSGLDLGYNFDASVYYDNSTNREVMSNSDGYHLSTGYDPYTHWGSYWEAQWLGEVFDYKDTIPGTSTSPAYFASLAVQKDYHNTTWSTSTGFVHDTLNNQGCYHYQDSDDFYIYHDTSCP